MYNMKNGVLHKEGKPVFCIGLSYYPSYHERKVPVPESGDRIGEMKKDLRLMVQEGFNLVRVASIGDVKRVDNEIVIHTEFIDELLKEADKVDIATMVRLQGYSMNFSGYDDFYMIDQNGKEMNKTIWYDFLQNSLYHEGILHDNDEGTKLLAEHYCLFAKNLVSFQTYNEPHYPSYAMFDYHPATIKAYRKWLINKGIMSEEQAAEYNPPTKRPQKDENPTEWINWRMFSFESLANFLNHSADVAKRVNPEKESLTCLTSAPSYARNIHDGISYFDIARGMDVVGITHYVNTYGAPYYQAGFLLDNAESAAALNGKHFWLVEYDARTDISLRKFYEETYMAIGAGAKGIMYYQWRGDYVFEDSPEGNGFGFLNYDGTPTNQYEEKMAMVKLLNQLSDIIVNAEKKRCGVAVLHSKYAFCHADAIENGSKTEHNSYLQAYQTIYKQLRSEGISVDFVEAENLSENKLNIQVLYVPYYELLSEAEKQMVQDFVKQGKKVYCFEEILLYRDITEKYDRNIAPYNIQDTIKLNNIEPVISTDNSAIMIQVLVGQDYYLACLNNISATDPVYSHVKLKLNDIQATKAYWYTPEAVKELEVDGANVDIPTVREGGFLLLKC